MKRARQQRRRELLTEKLKMKVLSAIIRDIDPGLWRQLIKKADYYVVSNVSVSQGVVEVRLESRQSLEDRHTIPPDMIVHG